MEQPLVAPLGSAAQSLSLAGSWGKEWGVGSRQPQIMWPDLSQSSPLPTLSCQLVRDACATFPSGTGLGWEKLHPRALCRLCDEALLALIRIFILVELIGEWPANIGIVLICLLPKPDGGRRPIGLMPSLIRLWMRVRLDVVRVWRSGPMKGASVAAWKQAARAEWANSSDLDYISTLLDLVKAFERVPHDWLVHHAIALNYPIRILKLSVKAYLLGRVIIVDGVASPLIWAERGITAGSVFATIELRVLLISCMDRLVYRFPSVALTVYVDDTGLEVIGPARMAIQLIVVATRFLIDCLVEMRLELSPNKNVCCASRLAIAFEVCRQLSSVKFKVAGSAKSLGAAITASRSRNTQILKNRLQAFRLRVCKYRQVRKTIGTKRTHMLLRTGGLPALVYGQANTGVSTSHLTNQRRVVGAASVATGAGDLDLTLMIADGSLSGRADPAFAAHCDPIAAWAEAVWCSWLPIYMLASLVNSACRVQDRATNIWATVRGPAAAFVASARRLGWRVVNAIIVIDDRDHELHFDRDSPAMIRHLVEASVRRWRWRSVEARYLSLNCRMGGKMEPIWNQVGPLEGGPDRFLIKSLQVT